jgi:plastocyanin
MRRLLVWLFVGVAAIVTAIPAWATIDTVTVQNFSFTPANITIAHGDTVVWHCTQGFHSVTHRFGALFGNQAQSAPWYYMFVFNDIGDSSFHYWCSIHTTAMEATVTVQGASDVPQRPAANSATGFALLQNYPNPFNSQTVIRFITPTQGTVRISVLDVLGQTVRRVFAGQVSAGEHTVRFNADGLPSGLYFYRLEAPGGMIVRTMNYIK